jgi:hypothetical protein
MLVPAVHVEISDLSEAAYRPDYNLRPTSVTPIKQIEFLLLTLLNDSASFPFHSRIHVVRRGAVRPISSACRPIDEERGRASARASPFDISHDDNSRDSPPIRLRRSGSEPSSQVQSVKALGTTFIDVRLGPCRPHGLVLVPSSFRAYTHLAIATILCGIFEDEGRDLYARRLRTMRITRCLCGHRSQVHGWRQLHGSTTFRSSQ